MRDYLDARGFFLWICRKDEKPIWREALCSEHSRNLAMVVSNPVLRSFTDRLGLTFHRFELTGLLGGTATDARRDGGICDACANRRRPADTYRHQAEIKIPEAAVKAMGLDRKKLHS